MPAACKKWIQSFFLKARLIDSKPSCAMSRLAKQGFAIRKNPK
jgi:hypothetical protein